MGNQFSSKIIGIGHITLTPNTECKLMLKDVRNVLEMHLNLISVERLIIARGIKEGSLYFM